MAFFFSSKVIGIPTTATVDEFIAFSIVTVVVKSLKLSSALSLYHWKAAVLRPGYGIP